MSPTEPKLAPPKNGDASHPATRPIRINQRNSMSSLPFQVKGPILLPAETSHRSPRQPRLSSSASAAAHGRDHNSMYEGPVTRVRVLVLLACAQSGDSAFVQVTRTADCDRYAGA